MFNLLQKSNLSATLAFALFFLSQKVWNKDARPARGAIPPVSDDLKSSREKELSEVHIAIIADEMTYANFSKECHVYSLTPNNWKEIFRDHTIDIFLCESAWEGRKANHPCWRGRIYRNHRVIFETRKTLFEILDYCKSSGIPSVFWNKEDPTYWGNNKNDFVDTALHFQYVFTTAAECIPQYQQRGASNVGVMMFGFSPYLYNPYFNGHKKSGATFAGSWFSEHKRRCEEERTLFDKVLNAGLPLVIYDRQSSNQRADRKYPKQYQKYVHAALPPEKLGDKLKEYQYAININTVTNSETMFARRVYELMASGIYVLSNYSKAMELQLNGRYGNLNDPIPQDTQKICRNNVDYVFSHHTNQARLSQMLNTIGLSILEKDITIAVCGVSDGVKKRSIQNIHLKYCENLKDIDESLHYFIKRTSTITDSSLKKMVVHASYINKLEICGIRENENFLYQIIADTNNENVLFPINMLPILKNDFSASTKKYYI